MNNAYSYVYIVENAGCLAGCCKEIEGVFSSVDTVKKAFPDLEYTPTQWGYAQLVNNGDGYFVEYYVHKFALDVPNG